MQARTDTKEARKRRWTLVANRCRTVCMILRPVVVGQGLPDLLARFGFSPLTSTESAQCSFDLGSGTAAPLPSRNASVPWMFSPDVEIEPSSVPARWVLQAPSTMQSNAYDMAKENGTSDCCCYKDSVQSDARLLPGCWEPCLEPAPTEHQTCMCTASLVPVELASCEFDCQEC